MSRFPDAGDIIRIDFDPQRGHEFKKKRPALVVSNASFSRLTGMVFACPVTSTIRNYPLRVKLDERTETHGEIACDQLRALDFVERGYTKIEEAPPDILKEALEILDDIIGK